MKNERRNVHTFIFLLEESWGSTATTKQQKVADVSPVRELR
jgi:hypothetical protein